MATRKYMIVYFDDLGDIKCISPGFDTDYEHFAYSVFEVGDVKPFISGTKSLATHMVVRDKNDDTKFLIESKKVSISSVKVIDRFLTEVNQVGGKYSLDVANITSEKILRFSLNTSIRKSLLAGRKIETESINIMGVPVLSFYFTWPGDPSFLIETVEINTSKLVNEEYVDIPYSTNLDDSSLFTKKVFEHYTYTIKR